MCWYQCFFSPWHTKVPVTHLLWNFDTGTFDFSRAYYRRLSRARSKISRSFFPKLSRASWKIHGLSNIVVTGTLTFVTGTFVLWSQNFRSHNKGDILESRFNGLQFMRLFVFEKNKLVFGYRVFTGLTPKMTNPLNKNLCWKVAKLEARLSKGRLTFKSSNL